VPDAGDLFFDMEGDPLEDGGLEYLFGVWYLEQGTWTFRAFWAHDGAHERTAFEEFMDFVVERRRRVVLDSNSTVIDLGERKRVFTGNARLAATLLQQHCQHPGCEVPADHCQIDHYQSHAAGGRTDQSNAGPACGIHNRHKYTHGWRKRRADNGRTYNIRADGTVILFTGERPPPFTRADNHDEQQHGVEQLETLRRRLQREYLATG
jgi:hypothetical protein